MTPDAQRALERLAAGPAELTSERVGYGASPSDSFALFQRVAAGSTRDELHGLLGHPAAVVRAYAGRRVVEEAGPLALLRPLLADPAALRVIDACSVFQLTLGRHLFDSLVFLAARSREAEALLLEAIRDDRIPAYRSSALGLLAAHDEPGAADLAARLLSEPDADQRRCLEVLGIAARPEHLSAIAPFAAHPRPFLRRLACPPLGRLRALPEAQQLLERLRLDEVAAVRTAAKDALALR